MAGTEEFDYTVYPHTPYPTAANLMRWATTLPLRKVEVS